MDAGDISPFLVLVSPTKRCGKTSALIILLYLTPRSELASNISPSALFRYVEDIRPTQARHHRCTRKKKRPWRIVATIHSGSPTRSMLRSPNTA
jgi:hypothetical protein